MYLSVVLMPLKVTILASRFGMRRARSTPMAPLQRSHACELSPLTTGGPGQRLLVGGAHAVAGSHGGRPSRQTARVVYHNATIAEVTCMELYHAICRWTL